MRLLGHFHSLEILPVAILDVLLDPEAAFQGLVLCIVSNPLFSTTMYVGGKQTHMGYHHNTILGQCEIQLNGISPGLNGTLEPREGILGVLSLEAPVTDYLGRLWCIIADCSSGLLAEMVCLVLGRVLHTYLAI